MLIGRELESRSYLYLPTYKGDQQIRYNTTSEDFLLFALFSFASLPSILFSGSS